MANQDGWVDVDEGWVDVPNPAQPQPRAAPKPTATPAPRDFPMVNPVTGKYNDGFAPVDNASLPPMDSQPVPKDFGSRPGDPQSFAQNAQMPASVPVVDRGQAKGAWDRFTHAYQGNVQFGFPGLVARKVFDWTNYGMDEVRKAHPGATPEQLEQFHDAAVAESQKVLRERYEAETQRDPAWRPDESWVDNILSGRWAAAIPGIMGGQAGPEMLIAPGSSTLGRMGAQGAVNAAADVAYQGADLADNVSDHYDPMQTLISAGAGAGMQGVFEGVAKLGKGWKAIRSKDGGVEVTGPNGEQQFFGQDGTPETGYVGGEDGTWIGPGGRTYVEGADGKMIPLHEGPAFSRSQLDQELHAIHEAQAPDVPYEQWAAQASKEIADQGGLQVVDYDPSFDGVQGRVTDTSPDADPEVLAARAQLEEMYNTPRTPEEQAAYEQILKEERDLWVGDDASFEKALTERDMKGNLRAALAERGLDQFIVDRPPPSAEVVPFPAKEPTPPVNPAEPTPLIATNDNPNQVGFDPRYAEQPAGPLAARPDGTPVAANDQLGTPDTFGRVDGSGRTDTQDVTVYNDAEARQLMQERTGQTPPPPVTRVSNPELNVRKEDVLTGGGEGGGEPPKSVIDRLTDDLKTAGKARKEQDQLYKEERAKRFQNVDVAQTPGMGQQALINSKAALKGELPKAQFEAVGEKYSQADVDELFENIIAKPTLTNMQKVSAQDGLMKLMQGRVPQPKELQYLSEVFPKEFIKAALSKRDVFSKGFGKLGEAWNMPKSLMSSADLSAPLRQGIGLSYRGEYWKAFGNMFKYALSQKKYDMLDEAIKTHPNYALADEAGLSLTVAGGKLGPAEDAFRSHLAEKLPVIGPIVRGSERAYVGFLNKLRFDTFNSLVADAEKLGHDLNDPAVTKGIARYINVMTGRGGLGKLEPAAGALNGALFSPRLISSRLQMLTAPVAGIAGKGMIADLPKGLRREAAKSYAAMIGAYSTAIGLASLAGYSVVDDPRSSDFGKIRDGNTRVDLGSGLIQYITAGTRALLRESTSVKSGETRELTRRGDTPLDSDLKFIFNKLHPSLSLIIDQQRGTDAVGQPANASAELPVVGDLGVPWSKAILSRISPMGLPDIYQTLKEHPDQKGAFYSVLGLLGAGLQNFDDGGGSTSSAPDIQEVTISGVPDKDGWVDVK